MFFTTYTAAGYSRLTCRTTVAVLHPAQSRPCPCPLSSPAGVPRQHRGEIWKFLSEQYLLRQTVPSRPPANHTPYKELLKQLTSQQHAILIDLGNSDTHTFTCTHFFRWSVMKLFCYMEKKPWAWRNVQSTMCSNGLIFLPWVYVTNLNLSLLRSKWIFIHNCYWR